MHISGQQLVHVALRFHTHAAHSTAMIWLMIIFGLSAHVEAHGFLKLPPGRSAAWAEGFATPINYDRMGLNCGGFSVQHSENGGLCGVCGDIYALSNRPNEPGPGNVYAQAVIVGSYTEGETFILSFDITAFHRGYVEMKLCDNDVPQAGLDASVRVTQECLDLHLLQSVDGETRLYVPGTGIATYTMQLPPGVVCEACVLQWKYRTGNNWGTEIIDGEEKTGLGYGPQEEFINCADIRIMPQGTAPTTTRAPTTRADTTSSPTSQLTTTKPSTSEPSTSPTSPPWSTTSTPLAMTSTSSSTTTPSSGRKCYHLIKDDHDSWCDSNCAAGNCPPELCWCDDSGSFPIVKICQSQLCNIHCNLVGSSCPLDVCHCVYTQIDPSAPTPTIAPPN